MAQYEIPAVVKYEHYETLEIHPEDKVESIVVTTPDSVEKPELAKMLRLLADSLDG